MKHACINDAGVTRESAGCLTCESEPGARSRRRHNADQVIGRPEPIRAMGVMLSKCGGVSSWCFSAARRRCRFLRRGHLARRLARRPAETPPIRLQNNLWRRQRNRLRRRCRCRPSGCDGWGVLMAGDRRDREALARLDALQDGLVAKGLGPRPQSPDRSVVDCHRRRSGHVAKRPGFGWVFARTILVAADGASAKALMDAAGSIPVVFANVVDPVGVGLVKSLEQPGAKRHRHWPLRIRRQQPSGPRCSS